MACLGGTRQAPRVWFLRRLDDMPREQLGRGCRRTETMTDPAYCSGCVAFRGMRSDHTVANGLDLDGEPLALSEDENAAYEAALAERDMGDEERGQELVEAFFRRLQREAEVIEGRLTVYRYGDGMYLRSGDNITEEGEAAFARRAAYMRRYRAEHGSGSSTARVQRLRARRKRAAGA